MNIGIHVQRAALWYPNRTAVVFKDIRFTYRELNERINRLANGLLSLGLKTGDKVALLSANCHQLLESEFACYKVGLVAVPLNFRLDTSEVAHMLNNSQASALIFSAQFIHAMQSLKSQVDSVRHYIAMSEPTPDVIDYESFLQRSQPEEPEADPGMDDLACLKYTSGTSGKLKAAMLSHRNRITVARKRLLTPGVTVTHDSVLCHVGPVTHASGSFILPIMWRGGCNLILPRFDVEMLLEMIEKERVTHMFLAPTMINMIISHPDITRYDLSSIDTISYGASPMPLSVIQKAIEVFGPVLVQGYGQTETSAGITFLLKEDHVTDGDPQKVKRLMSAGRPCIESEVRVVNENGQDVQPGQVGEIIERGDDSMLGYWRDPELTAQTLINGWVYTRDMATVDEDGYIYIVDRKSDMIISGGFNIYPSEVENVLYMHPAVYEAAVVSVPDEVWGESVKAVVVLKEGAKVTEDEIIAHCKENLASFKKPKSVDIVEQLPKTTTGKILRREVKAKYWAGFERMVH